MDKECLIITLTFSLIEIQSLYQNLVFDNIQISCKVRCFLLIKIIEITMVIIKIQNDHTSKNHNSNAKMKKNRWSTWYFIPNNLLNFSLLNLSGVIYNTLTLPDTISAVAVRRSSGVILLSNRTALIPSFRNASTFQNNRKKLVKINIIID